MGILDLFKKSNSSPKGNKSNKLDEPIVLYNGEQGKGFRGYKVIPIVTYNGNDKTCFTNAKTLNKKYGELFEGSNITLTKINYTINPEKKKRYLIEVCVDGLKVGVIFDGYEEYKEILNGKIEKYYCKSVDETIVEKGKTYNRTKAILLGKYVE